MCDTYPYPCLFHTTSITHIFRPHSRSTPASGQARGGTIDTSDGAAAVAGASRKAFREGVPAAKIDGRLTVRFVAAEIRDSC